MSNSKTPVKVLIVDDHAFVRQGLTSFFSRQTDFQICGEAASRADALRLCFETHPDIALIDLSLGADSGLDLIKDITVQFPHIKMLVLSMQDELLYADRSLRAGASGYIGKDTPPALLTEAIRCVLGGGVYVSESVKQKIMQSVRRADAGADPITRLSDRELEVFERIGKGQGTSEIAEAMELSIKTVETYRARIKAKLGARNSAELVQRAVQRTIEQSHTL